ncbi:PREDICTED: uncharacterized protein LOC104720419 [Camelina sativa]|uniref:Uncharacterized protein LOC104720419 n=1 Tax=Camelina sativa TaxID=90675 RepID=A0ABM0U6G2_CAMSA|nr:PREDICTED: uncharacterized protein LOC104720419 [Camelina sativa]
MQGNRDGSWSLNASTNNTGSGRGNGNIINTVPGGGGYLPQANPVFPNFNQQPIRYPLPQFPANFYRPSFPDFSLGNPNFQPQPNLSFHPPQQIPHQFGANANVFLQNHSQNSFSFPLQSSLPINNDISTSSQNHGTFESSSFKRRRQEEVVVQGTDVVPPSSDFAIGESANSFSVTLPISTSHNVTLDKSSAKPKRKVEVMRIDKAVNKTRKAVAAAGESVSSTRVSRAVLEELQADSWRSLGVQMQDVPSLRQLMAIEGKINAFIHCFVGARRIVTLYDLEVAICRNEFVDSFDDLELGPLLQHPLVLLYFPSISSSTGPVQITSEEIITFLDSYLHTYMTEDVKLDEFLNFVASQKSVTSKEKLGVRIQSLRMYVSFILDAKRQEGETLKVLLTELHQKYHIPSSKKQRQDKPLTVSERADSFALHHKDYCGKHTRFDSSSSDDNDNVYEVANLNSSDHINSCPYPSVAEEMKRLGGSNKKRKGEKRNHEKSDSSKLLRKSPSKSQGRAKQEIPKLADDSDAKKVLSIDEADFTLSEGDLRLFISTWKDTCKELSISTFVEKMLSFYNLGGSEGRAQIKRAKAMSSFPFVGLLNVAVTSLRRGMWDSIDDNLQMTSLSDTTNTGSGNQVGEINPSENRELSKTQHVMPPKHSNTVEEIIRRLSLYFEHDLSGEKHIGIFRKLQSCEVLLVEQFQVHNFESLGWGGFFTFLEKHMLLLPTQLQRFLSRELREEFPLEAHVNENLLTLLLSQASEFSGDNVISREMVARLLAEQFPSINFKVVGRDSEENFTEIIAKKKSYSKCVLFSATLLGAENSLTSKHLEESLTVGNDTEARSSILNAVASKEVLDVLLRVPLLSDLNSWCHWDLRYAPQFGPLMGLFITIPVQNADDNKYPEHVEPTLTFILQKTGIVVLNNECGFMPENIRALCDVGRSTKKGSGGYIGKKGIGFKSVFRDAGWNTCITLPFRAIDSERTTVNHIEPMFSDLHPSLLLFLHRLQCIVYRNMLDDSLLVMRKEVVSKNIIKISCGENSMTWFVASEKLKASNLRDGVQTTEISIGFTLDMMEDGTYRSCMIQEPVFAFLPLRTYGLKFIIQGDFILTSSREDVDEDSPWNQWLLSEFPGLFVDALRSFCSLPSFAQNLGKAVSSYMQLVPLVGEVHGFFSSLPRSIISRLRTTNCLLLEGDGEEWVPPCKVLRNWNEKIRVLLKDGLLQEHLALGFLDKDIVLSDSLSRSLGIEDYGPKTLVQILSSLSHKKGCLQSMGFAWLSSIITELYILFRSSGHGNVELGIDKTLIDDLHKIPFIPLSNGKFTSLDEGAVWLHHDTSGLDLGDVFEAFPMLYGNLRTIDHSLLLASSVDEKSCVDDLTNMLCAIGVQKLSAHEIIKVHILPAFEARIRGTEEGLMVDYLCFVMTHLRSGCHICHNERNYIISELRSKALILSNYGLKQLGEGSIHFGEEFGNQVNMKKLTKNLDILWPVVDGTYLKHPASKFYACGLKEWRDFFQEIGIADFVQVVQVEKSIAEFYSVSRCEKYDINLLSPELVVKDWESPELVDLLSLLNKSNGRKGCKYLLEVLDRLWDDCYHDKATVNYYSGTHGVIRSSESSFMRVICDSQWIVSSMDNKLHLAKDLYHDCDDVKSILGLNAPYAVPKVTSVKLLSDIGFKTKVCLNDALEILETWVHCGDSFKSSISQITRFYKYLWNEMADSKEKISEKLHTLPSVFVPHEIGSRQNDLISGIFLPLGDVYWNDSAGVLNEIKEISSQISSVVESLRRKTLCTIYPGLHDFFVNGCGVPETPPFQEYLKILGQFAHYVSPSCAAKAVFKIFLKWSDDLNSGKSSEDVVHFKERLSELEYTVLPTENDKWVSLHSSFGLVCWCDDEKLKKRFKKKDNIEFINFGENDVEEQEVLQTKVSGLMHSLGIPSISEVVKREAKYEGSQDNTVTVSLVNWALPYAQRYIYTVHHVKWVNDQSETGLPYDLLIESRGGKKEYVEVKATVSTRKDYFNLTVREWQFANEKGDGYIIAHVLLGNSNAILTQHRNPVKLCQEGHLRLLILMPNQRNEVNVSF